MSAGRAPRCQQPVGIKPSEGHRYQNQRHQQAGNQAPHNRRCQSHQPHPASIAVGDHHRQKHRHGGECADDDGHGDGVGRATQHHAAFACVGGGARAQQRFSDNDGVVDHHAGSQQETDQREQAHVGSRNRHRNARHQQ